MTDRLKRYILSQVANQNLSKEEAKLLLMELADSGLAPSGGGSQPMDIAIIGMAGRFPGASNLKEFWRVLREGKRSVRNFPEARFRDLEPLLLNPYYSELLLGQALRPQDIRHIHSRAGYLEEIDKFDAAFFGIPPNEAIYMDPYHRLALEVAWEAMENAGYGGDRLYGSKTGIYMGKEGTNYSYYRHRSEGSPLQLTGSWESLMISRISYLFDFKGPCMLVDTACSAGLVSIHMAAQALAAGECDQALAGGVNVSIIGELKPGFQTINLGNVESGDAVVRTFDAKAAGTVWGEGIGLVMLKPLKQAQQNGDHIYAVIKGSALNNDGYTNSLVAPKAETQEEVIVAAWQKAGIPPDTISYVEAHGTGTVLGDPIEVKGLSNAFRRFTDRRQFCAIGSLKTNMGHLVGASGVASLIKVVQSMEHKELPPTLNFETPNPYINFADGPLYVNDTLMPWDTNGTARRAAISSFGFSRTNCHMVVEEPPAQERNDARQCYYCLTISAQTDQALDEYIRRYAQFVAEDDWTLPDVCYTSNTGRGHYESRAMIIAESDGDLRAGLEALLSGRRSASVAGQPEVLRGGYTIVSEKKQRLEPGEISKHERSLLSAEAMKKLRRFIDGGARDRTLLAELGQLYILGADLNWDEYYIGESRRRIPAPTYPFQAIRCWAEPKTSKVKAWPEKNLHPLVQRRSVLSSDAVCYESVLRTDEQWVLSDHRIQDKAVLPGTCYVEMVRFAAQKELHTESLELQDVFFLTPLWVKDGQECLVRLVLSPCSSTGGLEFAVSSQTGSGSWVTHAEGKVAGIEPDTVPGVADLSAIMQQADAQSVPSFDEAGTEVFAFGPHWDTVREIWRWDTDAVARQQLREEMQHELDVYRLHPSVLDNAVNLTSQDTGATFLPFMYKSIRVHAPMTKDMFSHIRLKRAGEDTGESMETMTYDIDLLSPEGRTLIEIRDYTVKRVHDLNVLGTDGGAGSCMQMVWVPREHGKPEGDAPAAAGPVAVIGTDGPRLRQLEAAIAARGLEVIVYGLETGETRGADASLPAMVPDEQGFDRFMESAEKLGIATIVFASDYTLEAPTGAALDEQCELGRKAGVEACFQLCRKLRGQAAKKIKHVKVLMREAWRVDGSESGISPWGAATAGLSKVIAQEYRHLQVDALDASGDLPPEVVVDELFTGSGWRAIRPGGVFVEELEPRQAKAKAELPVRPEGAYLISGGLGGIGLAIAERLAEKGRPNLILLGRRSLASPDEWERLAESGEESARQQYRRLHNLRLRVNNLEYHSLDVSDGEAVRELGENLRMQYGSISGIFHTAGVAGDGFLLQKDEQTFRAVLAPKLDGSIHLLGLIPQANDDAFMVLFSSITALTGGEGQGDYCAANAFLDGLADWGVLNGRNIRSINWPAWGEAGMSVDYKVDQAESLFGAIRVQEGLDWLEHLIVHPEQRFIPAPLQLEMAAKHRQTLPFRLSPRIAPVMMAYAEVAGEQEALTDAVRLKGTLEPTGTQQIVANAFGGLLGLQEVDMYASFQDMGGNSLITTHLLTQIERHFPGVIDISDIFSYPSVHDLAELIDSRMTPPASDGAANSVEAADGSSQWTELIEQELKGTEFLDVFLEQMTKGGRCADGQ